MAIRDKILNKITGRNMETVPMTLEQMVELLKKVYISQAETDEDYEVILKTIKGSIFTTKRLESKDGKHEIVCATHRKAGVFNLKDTNWIWIYDKETDKFYEYRALFWGKFKKSVRQAIASAKAKI